MKITRNILLALLAILGLGALGGGGVLIISPSGKLIGMPLSMLDKSPFNNFMIPGIILFVVLGIAPLLLIIALLKKPSSVLAQRLNFFKDMHWTWSFTIYLSFALIIWIQVQMILIGGISWLHTFYVGFALVMIFVALLPQLRSHYKR